MGTVRKQALSHSWPCQICSSSVVDWNKSGQAGRLPLGALQSEQDIWLTLADLQQQQEEPACGAVVQLKKARTGVAKFVWARLKCCISGRLLHVQGSSGLSQPRSGLALNELPDVTGCSYSVGWCHQTLACYGRADGVCFCMFTSACRT
jgi:hypothetical protein